MKLEILHQNLNETVGHWEPIYDHPGWPKGSKYKKKRKKKKKKESSAQRQNLSFRVDQ
jgi:hypothetical protein